MSETIYERHRREMEDHFFDGTNHCWCGPTWETFQDCDGTLRATWTHHMRYTEPEPEPEPKPEIHMCEVCRKWPRMSQVDDGGVGGMICQVCYYDL